MPVPGPAKWMPGVTAPDMCFCETLARSKNLSQDFNVFLVGNATLATFPANANGGVDEEA